MASQERRWWWISLISRRNVSICLPVCPSVRLSLSIYRSIYRSISIYLYLYLSLYLSRSIFLVGICRNYIHVCTHISTRNYTENSIYLYLSKSTPFWLRRIFARAPPASCCNRKQRPRDWCGHRGKMEVSINQDAPIWNPPYDWHGFDSTFGVNLAVRVTLLHHFSADVFPGTCWKITLDHGHSWQNLIHRGEAERPRIVERQWLTVVSLIEVHFDQLFDRYCDTLILSHLGEVRAPFSLPGGQWCLHSMGHLAQDRHHGRLRQTSTSWWLIFRRQLGETNGLGC